MTDQPKSIHDLKVKDANGKDVDLSIYKGKVLLIVNVASKCGLTNSNYSELNQLYAKFKDQGFEILAFPCNQFGDEEPGSNEQILEFVCTRYKSEFPVFDKIEVNGENAAPVYKFLKSGKRGIFGDDIQWNFTKILVGRNGQPVGRYYPTTSPLTIEVKTTTLYKNQFENQFTAINLMIVCLFCREMCRNSWNRFTKSFCTTINMLKVLDSMLVLNKYLFMFQLV
ncbi:hypothetical protein SSX86_009352 [Deinandra increscens subsp. villosa]|uniref:Glutathione peroxidase n=1 Tax=Deinandra increscens subsp. villosa TaxID=3103831 RepID=A0AAP0H5J5_9ASTR